MFVQVAVHARRWINSESSHPTEIAKHTSCSITNVSYYTIMSREILFTRDEFEWLGDQLLIIILGRHCGR